MSAFRYDLHVHSCLSPCADDDMTPFSIAGMAKLNGLDLVALTDHNACGNCPAFFTACERYGLVPVPGMELTTAEEIHLVCLLPDLPHALAFEQAVAARRRRIPNRPEVFGRQLLVGENDEVVGEAPDVLIFATALTLGEAFSLTNAFDGACYPAHIDREANGILAVLGDLPEDPAFAAVEFQNSANILPYGARGRIGGRRIVASSDAHRLWEIADGEQALSLPCGGGDAQTVRNALIARLRGL